MKHRKREIKFTTCFAAILRDHRRRQGISQERLAHEAGLDRTYIGLIERGKRQCTVLTAKKLSRALGCSLTQLIAEAEEKSEAYE